MKIGGNIMDIDNLMDELEDILEASWRLPLSGGKAMVDTSEVKRILEDIRLALPREVVQAKKIVDESYHGSIKNFVCAFTGYQKLTNEEKNELLNYIERL